MLKKIYKLTLLFIGLFLLLNAIFLTFTSAINLGVVIEGFLGLLILTLAIIGAKLSFLISNQRLKKILAASVILVAMLFTVLLTPIIYHGIPRNYTEADFVIILGAGLRGEMITWTLQERLDKGIEYLNIYPNTKVVVSGGQGPGEYISEALAMERYLIAHGIDKDRIVKEDKSTSTFENFVYTKKVLDAKYGTGTKNATIITNDFHMFRAKLLAKRNNIEPQGLPCTTPWPIKISSYLRETLAIVKSIIFDK